MDSNLFLGRRWEEYAAWLTRDLDGVVVVVVPDFLISTMECLPYNVLGHVNSGGQRVSCLDSVFPISPDSGSPVPEYELLETPLPANIHFG